MNKKLFSNYWLFFLFLGTSLMTFSQNFIDPPVRVYNNTLRGDINIIGNNILNRNIANGSNAGTPNQPYNGGLLNNGTNLQFIDIDSDNTTFNSSSATLALPSTCSRVRYAALYWGGTYNNNNRINGQPIDRNNLNRIRFRLPTGGYNDIVGTILHDTHAQGANQLNKFYGAWADVTSLVNSQTNPTGIYTVANVVTGTSVLNGTGGVDGALNPSGGYSSGWSLFIVYEDPTQVFRNISSFNAASLIGGTNILDIPVTGFQTIPVGPVRAKIAFNTLEGDYNITGDRLRINGGSQAITTPNPVRGNTDTRPVTNFFNATINNLTGVNLARTPNSDNTFGWDTGLINVNNPNNSIIANNATNAIIRLETSGDQYFYTFTAFAVDVINPDIQLTKTAYNAGGTSITTNPPTVVNLGDVMRYDLCFRNVGNDGAINYTIRDVLPANVDFLSASVPTGVTYTFTPPSTLVFTIPNSMVPAGETLFDCISIYVRVISDCNQLRDACDNYITNRAFQTYSSQNSGLQVRADDPSNVSFDACGFGITNSVNILGDRSGCNFTDTFVKCSDDDVIITGPLNYTSYEWYIDGPPPTGTLLATTSTNTIPVSSSLLTGLGPWQIYLHAIAPTPCTDIDVTINIENFDLVAQNPLPPVDDITVICPSNGQQLSKFFLCGANATRDITINVSSAASITWYRISGCTNTLDPNFCPNTDPTCTFTQVGTGLSYTINSAGNYKLTIVYQNGCRADYYFDVFQNLFTATETHRDIICSTPGRVTVSGVPSNYLYALVAGCGTGVTAPPFGSPLYQASNIFNNITTPGCYTVFMIQNDPNITNRCIFSLSDINIRQRNVQVAVTPTNPLCHNGTGSVRVEISDAEPQYTYQIFSTPSNVLVGTSNAVNVTNFTFNSLSPGTYNVVTTTTDGCSFTNPITITAPAQLIASANIIKPLTCTPAQIQINITGGTPPYSTFVNGPPNLSGLTISVSNPGVQNITVTDANNCTFNTSITVAPYVPPVYNVTVNPVLCANESTGSVNVTVTNANGFVMNFGLIPNTGPIPTDPDALLLFYNSFNFSNVNSFSNLAAGTYYVGIRWNVPNSTDYCYDIRPITINNANPITATATLTPRTTCIATQQLCITGVSGGAFPYQYAVNGGTYQNGNCFTLNAGTYIPTVRDANGCVFTLPTQTINPLVPITDINFAYAPITCTNPTTMVSATSIGGNGAVTYTFTGSSNGTLPANLGPGTYTVTATDSIGCTYSEVLVILPVVPIGITAVVSNNVICFGTATGQASFNVSNFSTDYNYTVTGPTPSTATNQTASVRTLTGLLAGNYTVTVTDNATGCTATATFTITEPTAALALNPPTVVPITCSSPSGAVTINATGGWGNNVYEIISAPQTAPQQISNIFIGLTLPGTYTYQVRDLNGCTVTGSFVLSTPTPPTLTINPASDFCYDSVNQATITVSGSAGTGTGYLYAYSTTNVAPSLSSFTNTTGSFQVTPGTYYFFVADSAGCISSGQSVVINNQLTATASLTKALDCTISPNAVITVNISGGYPNYTYRVSYNSSGYSGPQLLPIPANATSFTYSAALPGTYQFQITDSRGCITQTNIITVSPLIPLTLNVTQGAPIRCFGEATGSLIVTPGGGQPPYDIALNGMFGASLAGLTAGTYTILVRDALSCTITQNITITQPNDILYTTTVNPLQCTMMGTSLGSIDVTGVSGGQAGYTYTLTGPGGPYIFNAATGQNHNFGNLNFGNYILTITDANGCNKVSNILVITSPPSDLSIDLSSPVVSCATGATINVTVTISGTPNLQYGLYTGNIATTAFVPVGGTPLTTWTFNSLAPCSPYVIIVRDLTTGCSYFESITTQCLPGSTLAITPTPRNITCTGANDGCIGGTVTGYHPTATQLSYQIVDFFNQPLIPPVNGTIAVGATIPCSGSLAPGQYYLIVRELDGVNAGCGTSSTLINIQQSATPPVVTATLTNNDNCNTNAGSFFATASGGTGPYQYVATTSATVPTAATWSTFSPSISGVFNVEAGTYTVYVKDAYDCIRSTTIIVPLDPVLDTTAAQVASTVCNTAEGAYAIDVTIVTGIGPFSYSLNSPAFSNVTPNPTIFPATFNIANLSSGTYTIVIRDKNGCTQTEVVTIRPPLDITANFVVQANPNCDIDVATITATATGGSGNYTYSMSPIDANSVQTSSGVFNNVDASATPYTITVTDNITGCTDTVQVTIPLSTPVTVALGDLTIANVSCNGGTNGSVTVNLPASNNQGPYTYTLLQGGVPVVIANNPNQIGIFTGLSAGPYTITVTSARNCVGTVNFTIDQPGVLSATGSVTTQFVCNSSNVPQAAIVTINALGGTAPYFYSSTCTNGSFISSNTFTILDTGVVQNRTFCVVDSNGCTTTVNVIINPLPVMNTPTVTETIQYNCTQNGELTVAVTGGSGNYTYTLIGTPNVSNTTGVFPVSAAGTYNFIVRDNVTTCTRTVSYTINPLPQGTAIASTTTNIACFGDATGVISIDISGYTGSYTYTLLNNGIPVAPSATIIPGVTGSSSNDPLVISGLPQGSYSVSFVETAFPFCSFISTVTPVVAPGSPVNGTHTTTPITCRTPSEGSITVNATGGTGMGYTVSFFQGAGPTGGTPITANVVGNTASQLVAGNYYYVVRDSNNCTFTSATITLTAPTAIAAGTLTAVPTVLQCRGVATATLTVTGTSGGFGSGYTYTLSQTNPAYPMAGDTNSTGVFSPKGAGTYQVCVTDPWGCNACTNTVIITEPATNVTATLTQPVALTCANLAQITLTATGGTAPYFYSNTNTNVTNPLPVGGITFSVPAGTYSFYVTDAFNCVVYQTNTIIIAPIPPVVLTVDFTDNVECFGDSSGSVQLSAVGGIINTMNPTQTYTYTIPGVGSNTTGYFTGLTAGNYTATASTSGGCVSPVVNFTITQPNAPLSAPTPPAVYTSCFNATDACVTVNPVGGTPFVQNGVQFYQYRIFPPNDQIYINQNQFCNLAPGAYTVEVKDANGCFVLVPITVIAPSQIVPNGVINNNLTEICFGDTVVFTGSVTGGREANPTAPYVIEIRNNNNVLVGQVISPTGNFTFAGLDSVNSPYTVTVYVQGTPTCNLTFQVTVNPGVDIQAVPNIDIVCTGTVPVQNVTIVTSVNNPYSTADLTYSLDNGPFTTNNFYSTAPGSLPAPLAPGFHSVVVRHTNGCTTAPIPFTIQSYAPLALLLTPNVALNQFSAIASGGTPNYTFTVNGTPFDFSQNYLVTYAGNYTVTVIDANGCNVTQVVYMDYIPIKIPNFFTPNGSGNNDTWAPYFIENYPDATFEIYDRYGRRLRILTYQEAWDGNYEGNPMPSGDYWYILKLNKVDDSREFVGNFTLYR